VPDSRHTDRQGDGRILCKAHQIPTTDAPARGEMTLVAWGMLIAAEGPGVRGGAMSHCRS
jgi:hypothetical protein